MRPSSSDVARSSFCLVLALLVVLAATGCDAGVRISLQLRTAADGEPPADASQLKTLTVFINNGEIKDHETLELDLNAPVVVPPLDVDRTKPFQIEVWACNRDDQCEKDDIILRGCTPADLDVRALPDSKAVVVIIEMYDKRDDVLARCRDISDP